MIILSFDFCKRGVSFDFTALVLFLQSLFDAFVKLAEKLGFKIGGDDAAAADDVAPAEG